MRCSQLAPCHLTLDLILLGDLKFGEHMVLRVSVLIQFEVQGSLVAS